MPRTIADESKPEYESQTMQSDILHQTLTYLRDLPASSPQWETDVPTFLSSATKLTEEKEAELAAAASLQALSRAIEELTDQYSAQLEYFELDVSGWTATTNANASSLAEAHGLIEELSGFIDEHSSIPERGSSLSETKRLDKGREEVEERILSTKSTLDRELTTDGGPGDSPPKPTSGPLSPPTELHSAAPEVSPDAALSDIQPSDGTPEFDPPTPDHAPPLHSSVDNLDVIQIQSDATATVVERAPSDDATLSSLKSTLGELRFKPEFREYSIELPDGLNDLSVTFKATHASTSVTASLEKPDGGIVEIAPSSDGVCEILGLEDGQSTLSLAVTAEDGVTRHTYTVTLTCRLDSVSEHVTLMWSLVAEDDLAGAFWISKSLAAQGLLESQVPILLKAVQGARWLSPESSDYVEDLFEAVSSVDPPFGDDAQTLLALAASIQPSLVAPETNLLAWLDLPSCLPSLDSIVSPIRDFAKLGNALGPEYIQGDEWQRHVEESIVAASSSAQKWLEDSSKRFQNFTRANSVWKRLCDDEGNLNDLLSAAAADNRSRVDTVKNEVESLRQEARRTEIIAGLNEQQRSSPRGPIVGAARDWLHRGIIEALDQAALWCELVERANDANSQSQSQWLLDNVAELRANIEAASQHVLDDLLLLTSNSEQGTLVASALCLTRSIHQLLDYLRIDYAADGLSAAPAVVADLLQLDQNIRLSGRTGRSNSQIEAALSRRLLWIADVELRDDGLPVNSEEPINLEIAEAEWFSLDTPLEAVLQTRIDSGDFRFLDQPLLDADRLEPSAPEHAYKAKLVAERETLTAHKDGVRDAVEQAANDGVLEFDGPRWHELTNSHEDTVVDNILNFRRAHDILERIEESLRKDRVKRRTELDDEWDRLISALKDDKRFDLEIPKEWSDTFELARQDNSLDIRVMEDCVVRIRDYRSRDSQDLPSVPLDDSPRLLEDFLCFTRGLGDLSRFSGRSKLRQMLSRHSDEAHGAEIESVARAWEDLRGERPRDRTGPTSRGRVGTVLRFLGLPYQNENDLRVRRNDGRSRWVHFTFETDPQSVTFVRGAPQFRSQANGTYHIYCLWEEVQPGRVTRIPGIDMEAGGNQRAVIALYLNALTEAERQDVQRESWEHDLTLSVIDDVLLAYLAVSRGDRLRSLVEVSLPFTAANPYNPETSWGARVAPEMFYGREQLEREILLMRGGTSLVFGGRQLGKTALLRHVEERFSDPELRRFAWFINLKPDGYVPNAERPKDPQDVLGLLQDRFRQSNILQDYVNGRDQALIRQNILKAFEDDRELQVLAMFDESDTFMATDWDSGSQVVESFRDLMDDTGNRFKVVFAGLHNVQRFANRPNNPFPNLGFNTNNPRRGGIGPLSDSDARSLVEQPFHLLGFRFEPLVVDKILSYTNRHPALLQFFCHELIRSYRQSNPDANPPFTIRVEDVDRTYRNRSIQEGIKGRFEATFELDRRYHVIALTMIVYQEHPTQSWSLDDLRSHCETGCPLTFDPDNITNPELKSLLDELIGLGVLAQDGDSYRMRSSLIAQMFGSEDEIFSTLDELEAGEPYEVG